MNIKQPSLVNNPSTPDVPRAFGLRFFWVLAVLLVGLFYLLDLWIPAHLAIPVCYAAALVLAVALPGKREKIAVALACTVMLLADIFFFHSEPGLPAWAGLANQGFALLMVWGVTTLGLRHRTV